MLYLMCACESVWECVRVCEYVYVCDWVLEGASVFWVWVCVIDKGWGNYLDAESKNV
jgi:hypothetical protein